MSTGSATIQKRKRYGKLHPSGLNRHQRRAAIAIERGAEAERQKQIGRDQQVLARKLRAERVHRRETTAQQKALARKEAVQ